MMLLATRIKISEAAATPGQKYDEARIISRKGSIWPVHQP
jgi:hypothetical protein